MVFEVHQGESNFTKDKHNALNRGSILSDTQLKITFQKTPITDSPENATFSLRIGLKDWLKPFVIGHHRNLTLCGFSI